MFIKYSASSFHILISIFLIFACFISLAYRNAFSVDPPSFSRHLCTWLFLSGMTVQSPSMLACIKIVFCLLPFPILIPSRLLTLQWIPQPHMKFFLSKPLAFNPVPMTPHSGSFDYWKQSAFSWMRSLLQTVCSSWFSVQLNSVEDFFWVSRFHYLKWVCFAGFVDL